MTTTGQGWDEILQTGSYAGIEFEFVSVSDDRENVLDKQRFVGRSGQVIQDRARGPLTSRVMAVFFEDSYPQTMNLLLAAIDAGGNNEYVHPIFGSMQAAAERAKVEHNSEEACDFASVEITFCEHTESSIGPFQATDTLPALAGAARAAADQVTAAASALQTVLESDATAANTDPPADQMQACVDAGTVASDGSTAADYLEQSSADLTVVEIEASINNIVATVDEINFVIADYQTPEAYDLSSSLTAMVFALEQLGNSIIEAKPPVIDDTVKAPIPLLVLAHALYKDSTRVSELLTLNSFDDPLELPAGLPLRRYAV